MRSPYKGNGLDMYDNMRKRWERPRGSPKKGFKNPTMTINVAPNRNNHWVRNEPLKVGIRFIVTIWNQTLNLLYGDSLRLCCYLLLVSRRYRTAMHEMTHIELPFYLGRRIAWRGYPVSHGLPYTDKTWKIGSLGCVALLFYADKVYVGSDSSQGTPLFPL